jgi:hypothetical protein
MHPGGVGLPWHKANFLRADSAINPALISSKPPALSFKKPHCFLIRPSSAISKDCLKKCAEENLPSKSVI